MTPNPLLALFTHAIPLLVGGMHFLDFTNGDHAIHMLMWDDLVLELIVLDGSCEVDEVASGP